MIEVLNVVSHSYNEGSDINVRQVVKLTEEDAIKYDMLDKLAREYPNNTDISDILSDFGWSYSNDVLGTRNWDSLDDVIEACEHILGINNK